LAIQLTPKEFMRLYLRGRLRGRLRGGVMISSLEIYGVGVTRTVRREKDRAEELHRPGPSGFQYVASARKSDARRLR